MKKDAFSLSVAVAALLMMGGSAFAANTTHTVSAGGTAWSTATWSNGVPLAVPGDTATYNTATTALVLTLDVNATIGELTDANSGSWTINSNGTNTFTLDPTGLTVANAFKTLDAAIANTSTGTFTVAPNIAIANGNLDLGTTNTGSLVISGGITGTGNILTQTTSSGVLTLSGLLNNSGAVTIGAPTGGAYLLSVSAGNAQSNSGTVTTISGGIGSNVTGFAVDSGVVNLTSADSSLAATTVNGGTLNLNSGGSITGAVVVDGGIFNDTVSTIASTASLTMGGLDGIGTFNETSTSAAQDLGTLYVTPGVSLITNSTANALVFAGGAGGYVRSNGAVVQFGSSTSNNKINFTAAPTGSSVIAGTSNGSNSTAILNGAVTDAGTDFVAAQAGVVTAATYLSNDSFNFDGNAVVTINDNLTAPIEIESLKFNQSSGNPALTLTGTNIIDSGGIIAATGGSDLITGGTIEAGAGQDLWVYAGGSGRNLTINSVIANNGSGSNGFDYVGTGSTLALGGNNTFTGAVYIDGSNSTTSNLTLNSVTALGATSSTANLELLGSVSITNGAGSAITINRNIILSPGTYTFTGAAGDDITLNGNMYLADAGTDNGLTLNKNGADTLYITGSFAGTPNLGVSINGGTLDVTGQIITDSGGWNAAGSATGALINIHGYGALSENGDFNFANTSGDTLTLDISNDASFAVGGRFFIGKAQGAVGIVNQSGGTANVANFFLGAGGTNNMYNLTGGTLSINGHNTTDTIDTGSILTVSGGTIVFGASDGNTYLGATDAEGGTAGEIVVGAGGMTVNSIGTSGNFVEAPILHSAALGATPDGGFTKTNSGTLTFVGGTYTGATTVAGGTLKEDFTGYATSALATSGTSSNDINSASALVLSGGTLAINGAKGGAGGAIATNSASGFATSLNGATTGTTSTITVASVTGLALGQYLESGSTLLGYITAINATTDVVTLSQTVPALTNASAISTYNANMITVVSGNTALAVGESVTGTGIASGTYVEGIYTGFSGGSTEVLLSQPTTAVIPSGTSLTFGTDTGLATVQTFNGTTVNAGGNAIALTNNGSSVTANLGAITRNTGGTLNMPALSSTTIVTTSNTADATGILGPWATVGSGTSLNYATVNGTGQVIAYTGATADATGALSGVTSATTNYKYTGAATLTGNQTGNTLQFSGAGANTSLNGNTLTLNGLMNSGTGALSIGATSSTADSATSALVAGSTNELVIQSNGQNVTINDEINDASPGSGSSLTWAGGSATATLTLNVAMEGYTGTTYDDQGVISIGANQNTLENSTLYLGGGTLTSTSPAVLLGGLAGNSNFAVPTAISTLEVGNNNQDTTYSGVLSGSTTLVKLGTGTLTLSGANTYTAATDIFSGTLAVNGSTAASTSALVNVSALSGSTATLTGTGTVGGPVTVTNSFGGMSIFNPGGVGAVGSMILSSNLSFLSGTEFQFELNSNLATMDSVFVGGNFTLTGSVDLVGTDLGNSAIAANTVFTLVQLSANGTMSGAFAGYADGSDITIGSNVFQINYGTLTGYGDDVTLMAVPEPNQTILILLGIAGLVGYRLRRATRVS